MPFPAFTSPAVWCRRFPASRFQPPPRSDYAAIFSRPGYTKHLITEAATAAPALCGSSQTTRPFPFVLDQQYSLQLKAYAEIAYT